jgi:ABC-type glycerol-3-phosphate transport system permease component
VPERRVEDASLTVVASTWLDGSTRMAGSVIATLPMVLVFMIFQRQFICGISLSGLKG